MKYLLFYRWLIINIFGFSLLGVAYSNGWVLEVVEADRTYLTMVIFGVFLWGWALCGWRTWVVARESSWLNSGGGRGRSRFARYVELAKRHALEHRTSLAHALQLRAFGDIAFIHQIAHSLVLMGLIGTVIGFIIAMSGISADAVGSVEKIGPMVSTLIAGMRIALFTTLVGAVFYIWLVMNYYLLSSGAGRLVADILEANE